MAKLTDEKKIIVALNSKTRMLEEATRQPSRLLWMSLGLTKQAIRTGWRGGNGAVVMFVFGLKGWGSVGE